MYRAVTTFRGSTVSLIYAKTLELQAEVYDESTALTLMSTDIDRLSTSLEAACEIWARAIELAIGLWLLERQLGWICVAPLFIVAGTYSSMKFAGLLVLTSDIRINLFFQQSRYARGAKAKGMDERYPAPCRHDFFDARVNEKCQNDGNLRQSL